MTTPTLHQLLADVATEWLEGDLWFHPDDEEGNSMGCAFQESCDQLADNLTEALLASPELAAIIDLAAEIELTFGATASLANFPPEVRALLKSWREERSTTDG